MANLMLSKPIGTIKRNTDGGYTLYAHNNGKFSFAYVYPTFEAAEASAIKHKLIMSSKEVA